MFPRLDGAPTKYKMNANILVLNCGSSSLKYRLMSMPGEKTLASGEAERVGIKTEQDSALVHTSLGRVQKISARFDGHPDAFRAVMLLLKKDAASAPEMKIDAVAHRYVHPGNFFSKTAKLTKKNTALLKKTLDLAPLHNPVSFSLIDICGNELPRAPQYAVFDTSFHSTMPEKFYTYALPERLRKKNNIRRFGFHGISHAYVMQEACRLLDRPPGTQRIISCHLGTGGASLCAIEYGKSLANTMGFTPLEGLMMNTRSGNLDPALVLELMHNKHMPAFDAEKILIKQSGLLGLNGDSSDLRDIIKKTGSDEKCRLIFEMYVRRIIKYIGYYYLILRKADVLIFTDTIGMEMPVVREKVCEGLEFFGIRLNPGKNNFCTSSASVVSAEGSPVKVLCIPTNEELMIAREAFACMINGISGTA